MKKIMTDISINMLILYLCLIIIGFALSTIYYEIQFNDYIIACQLKGDTNQWPN